MTTVVKVKDRYLASKLSCYMCKSQGGLTANVKLHFYRFWHGVFNITYRSKDTRVKGKGHVSQGHMGQGH